MSIHIALEHQTSYCFDRFVRLAPHVVRLRPAPHCRTPVLSYSLQVQPAGHFVNWQQDPFGNYLARLVFPEPASQLSITVDLVADLTVINPFDFFVDAAAQRYPFRYEPAMVRDLAPYLTCEPPGPLLSGWLAGLGDQPAEGTPINDFLVEINQRLQRDLAYLTRMEAGVQSPEETLHSRRGSCRDSAWLLVAIMRQLGVAARFVSGYLVQLVADQPPLRGPAGPSEDFTDLHAWTEVYLPGAGWIGLDPTSGLFAGEGHLPLACTPEPSSAAPVTGSLDPCEATFSHVNRVRRVQESPRVTLPYTDEQWAGIDALATAVDADLAAGDVRLTQGGEPTFVSVDDMEAPEWTITPDGPSKRELAWRLASRLADRFAPGGLLQFGQGKWYPGEPLPRWQLGVLWRADGEPLWRAAALLADPWVPGEADDDDAQRLTLAIAARLGIPLEYCVPAYEDPLDRLAAEALLPDGPPPAYDVDPADPALADAHARARIVAELDADRGRPRGWTVFVHRTWVVPLHGTQGDGGGWATTRWSLRRKHLMLRPGDSPMGLRLPLASMTWRPVSGDPERSTFEERGPLPAPSTARVPARPATAVPSATVVPPDQAPPTALCVERRDGRLHVFLPPLEHLEHVVELLALVEAAVTEVGRPVVIEGYPPPVDPRLRRDSGTRGACAPSAAPGVTRSPPASHWRASCVSAAIASMIGLAAGFPDGMVGGALGDRHTYHVRATSTLGELQADEEKVFAMASAGREDAFGRRVLVSTDESELGELARRWAERCARELDVALVTLQGSSATAAATLAPANPADLLVLGHADRQGRVPDAAVDLVAAARCLTILMRTDGGNSREPVTAAVSGDPSDGAVLAAAVDLAAMCHAEVRLLHTRPLPLRRSDSPEDRWAGRTVLESARRQILRLAPDCTPSTELLRLQAQEAVCHHCGDGLLVLGARRSSRPGLGLVTRTALYHARSPVAVVHATHLASKRKRTQKASELSLS